MLIAPSLGLIQIYWFAVVLCTSSGTLLCCIPSPKVHSRIDFVVVVWHAQLKSCAEGKDSKLILPDEIDQIAICARALVSKLWPVVSHFQVHAVLKNGIHILRAITPTPGKTKSSDPA